MRNVLLVGCALLSLLPRPSLLSAANVPFRGQEVGVASEWPGTNIIVTGSGDAHHLGAYTDTLLLSVAPGVLTGYGSGTWSLALSGGDTLFGTADVPVVIVYNEPYVYKFGFLMVTGGTGRFAGATGDLTWAAELVTETGSPDPYTATLIGDLQVP